MLYVMQRFTSHQLINFHVLEKHILYPAVVPTSIEFGDKLFCLNGISTLFHIHYIFMVYLNNFSFPSIYPYKIIKPDNKIYDNELLTCNCTFFHFYDDKIYRNEIIQSIRIHGL